MRYYPSNESEEREFENLGAEPWMKEILKCNPPYTSWGNHEDYMIGGHGYAESQEFGTMKDFIHAYGGLDDLNEVVNFYFDVLRDKSRCATCGGTGFNDATNRLYAELGVRYGGDGRISDNESGVLRGSVKRHAVQLGVFGWCGECMGNRVICEGTAHVELQLWVLYPRKGASRGVRIKYVGPGDLPDVMKLLSLARDRNAGRFSGIDGIADLMDGTGNRKGGGKWL